MDQSNNYPVPEVMNKITTMSDVRHSQGVRLFIDLCYKKRNMEKHIKKDLRIRIGESRVHLNGNLTVPQGARSMWPLC